jgi:hypothetical protein
MFRSDVKGEGGTNTGSGYEKLSIFVRKLEFGLLLVVDGGVHEFEAGNFHKAGTAASHGVKSPDSCFHASRSGTFCSRLRDFFIILQCEGWDVLLSGWPNLSQGVGQIEGHPP